MNNTSSQPIKYSVGKDKFDNLPKQQAAANFADFAQNVLSKVSKVKGELYFCGPLNYDFHDDPIKYKEKGCYRLHSHTEPKRFLPLDFDGFDNVESFILIFEYLKKYSGFGYTTWSHKIDAPRARAILELDRDVSRAESILIGQALEQEIEEIAGVGKAKLDSSVYRSEQPIYGPPPNASIYHFMGSVLNVSSILARQKISNTQLNSNSTRNTQSIVSQTSCGKLTKNSLEDVLAKLDFKSEPIWSDVANILARVYGDDGREFFITFSQGTYAEDSYSNFDINEVNERYDRALAEAQRKPDGLGIKRLCLLAKLDIATLDFEVVPLTPEEKASQRAFFDELPNYDTFKKTSNIHSASLISRNAKVVFPILDKRNKPTQVTENLNAVLVNRGIAVRYNQIKKNTEVVIPGMKCVADELDNCSLTMLTDEVVKAGMTSARVDEMTSAVGAQNPYCPVQEYIETKRWDKTSRIVDFCNQVITPHVDMTHFLIRKWLLQAVAAVYEKKGINASGVIVFTGQQGVGKTRVIRELTSGIPNVFLEGAILNPDDKDSVFTSCSHWIVELGELDATFKKSEIAQIKAFLTKNTDTLRKPYARKDSVFPRRTVFAGTVNDFQFLHDPTGNRRFWPIEVSDIIHNDSFDYQQLWAECKFLYDSGESWHLSAGEMSTLNSYSEQFTVTEPVIEKLLRKYIFTNCTNWTPKLMVDICTDIGVDRPNKSEMQKLAAAIRKQNGNQTPKQSNGKKYHWVPA